MVGHQVSGSFHWQVHVIKFSYKKDEYIRTNRIQALVDTGTTFLYMYIGKHHSVEEYDRGLHQHGEADERDNSWELQAVWVQKLDYLWQLLWHLKVQPSQAVNRHSHLLDSSWTVHLLRLHQEILLLEDHASLGKLLDSGTDFLGSVLPSLWHGEVLDRTGSVSVLRLKDFRNVYGEGIVEVVDLGDRKLAIILSIIIGISIIFILHKIFYT